MRYLPLLLLIALTGCITGRDSLKPFVEKGCTEHRCMIYASADQVNRRCNLKVSEKHPLATWDDGTLRKGDTTRRARCCTVDYKTRQRRFVVWVSNEGDDWKCALHEECHIETFWKNGDHGRCDGFGADKKKNRLTPEGWGTGLGNGF